MRNKLLFLFLILFISVNAFSQDYFNEYNRFLNSDESAMNLRFNPAVLGMRHKFNLSLSSFIDNKSKRLTGGDVSFSSGGFGFSYDYRETSPGRNFNNYFAALGFGNRKNSFGFGADFLRSNDGKKGMRYTAALMNRFSEYFSFAAVMKFSANDRIKNEFYKDVFTAGIGIRPFKNPGYNLYLDFRNNFENGDKGISAGFDAKIVNGFSLTANYRKQLKFEKDEFFSAGISLNFGGFGFGFNSLSNTFSKTEYRGSTASLYISSEKKDNLFPVPKKNIQLVLSGSFQDYFTSDILFGLLGNGKSPFHKIIRMIDDASKDNSVSGMLLFINPIEQGRFGFSADVEEIASALKRFKNSGKKIVSYIPQGAGIAEYYLSTYADKIVLPREAAVNYGLSLDVINYKQFLAKYGINMEVFSAGKYKLTFQGLLDSTTAEGKEVIDRCLDLEYAEMMSRVEEGRRINLTPDVKKLLSRTANAVELRENKLIDVIGWYDDAVEELNTITGIKSLAGNYKKQDWDNSWYSPPKIAIIGVYGGITSTESTAPSPFNIPLPFISQGRTTGSVTVTKQLESAFANPEIKAIILRVSSGGGSALGSAEIYDKIKRLKKKYNKPFIVSMGEVAGSGGYYVSACADKIFANKTTVTGSIGVIGSMPKLDSLMSMLKIKAQNYKRGDNSEINSPYVGLSDESIEIIRKNIQYVYDEFITSVAEGRNMTKQEVEEVAQGRVWLGSDAKNNKLIDEIGGLTEAINFARMKCNISKDKNVDLVYFPVAGSSYGMDVISAGILEMISENILKFIEAEETDIF